MIDKNCVKCVHSKFDKVWGEYKCLKYSRRIHNLEAESENCEYYNDADLHIVDTLKWEDWNE